MKGRFQRDLKDRDCFVRRALDGQRLGRMPAQRNALGDE
jgi:hypothetical protein